MGVFAVACRRLETGHGPLRQAWVKISVGSSVPS
jgi:hypothetical protein